MSKESLVFLLGVIVLVTPFLGLPRDHKDWVLVISGALLILCGYQLRRTLFLSTLVRDGREGERKSDAFSESSVDAKAVVSDRSESALL